MSKPVSNNEIMRLKTKIKNGPIILAGGVVERGVVAWYSPWEHQCKEVDTGGEIGPEILYA